MKSLSSKSHFGRGAMIGLLLAVTLAHVPSSIASDNGNSRTAHRLGVYFSLLGDPFVSLWGINLGWNIFNFARLNGGYGSISSTFGAGSLSLTSIGGGIKFFVPNWGFSPVAGVNYSSVNVAITGSVAGQAVYGISGNTSVIYTNFGLDWQTHYGLMLGAGYNLAITTGIGGAPYFNLGWFF